MDFGFCFFVFLFLLDFVFDLILYFKRTQEKKRKTKKKQQIWLDVDEMYGSTLDAMAKAITGAGLVLVCMNDSYQSSPSCRFINICFLFCKFVFDFLFVVFLIFIFIVDLQ